MKYISRSMKDCFEAAEQAASIDIPGTLIKGFPGVEARDVAQAVACEALVTYTINPLIMEQSMQVAMVGECMKHSASKGVALIFSRPDKIAPSIQRSIYNLSEKTRVILIGEVKHFSFLDPDLRRRVETAVISVPPFSDRKDDWPNTVLYAVADTCTKLNKVASEVLPDGLETEVWDLILSRPWETAEKLEETASLCAQRAIDRGDSQIELRHCPTELVKTSPHDWLEIPFGKRWTMERLIDTYVLHCVARAYTKVQAAAVLGLSRQSLYNKIKYLSGVGRDPNWRIKNELRKTGWTDEKIAQAAKDGDTENLGDRWFTDKDIQEMRANPTEKWTRTGGRTQYDKRLAGSRGKGPKVKTRAQKLPKGKAIPEDVIQEELGMKSGLPPSNK